MARRGFREIPRSVDNDAWAGLQKKEKKKAGPGKIARCETFPPELARAGLGRHPPDRVFLSSDRSPHELFFFARPSGGVSSMGRAAFKHVARSSAYHIILVTQVPPAVTPVAAEDSPA